MCARSFVGPAYGYMVGVRRKGCFCDALCGFRHLHDSNEANKAVLVAACRQDGASYLLPPPRLLTCFGGPLTHEQWKRKQEHWEFPIIPQPLTVCVLSDAEFSTIKKPRRKLGRPLFPSGRGIKGGRARLHV